MTDSEFISTGIEKLDTLLEGGIPKGFTTLILGAPGSSIEILSKQLATVGSTVYFTTEETKDEIVETMDRFGWNHKNVDFIDIALKYSQNVLAILSNKSKSTNSKKIVINSLDFFLSQYSQDEVMRTIHAAKISNLKNRGALFIIMTRGIHGDLFERKMEGLADCVLELEVLQKGSNFERFLAVKKMRNYAKKIGIARYVIDSDGFVLEMIERIM